MFCWCAYVSACCCLNVCVFVICYVMLYDVRFFVCFCAGVQSVSVNCIIYCVVLYGLVFVCFVSSCRC